MIADVDKGIKYFVNKKKGKEPLFDKLEEAAGIEPTPPPKPPATDKKLVDKSTSGSPPFKNSELKRGFRKVGWLQNHKSKRSKVK